MKKLLALVLALVMTLGLATVGTNAAFNDADSIEHTEAVAVMNAIGVLSGDENGAFNPSATLTREQGAKIITYMLMGGKAAGDALTATAAPFDDVAADRWSAGAIQYCKAQGIIAGVGDNKFDPEGTLKGYEFAKMLLVALGYDAEIEKMIGDDWAVSVAKLVVDTSLADDIDSFVGSANVNRDNAAQLAFNTLTSTMVYYPSRIDSGTGNVNTNLQYSYVANTGSTYEYAGAITAGNARGMNNASDRGDQQGTMQLCEKYFSKLAINTADHDEAGRVAETWNFKGEQVTSTSKTAAYKTVVSSRNKTFAKVVTDYNGNLDVTTNANVTYINGAVAAANTSDALVGDVVEIFTSSNDVNLVTRIVVSRYSAAMVTGEVTTKTSGGVEQVTVPGVVSGVAVDRVHGYEGLSRGDIVYYYTDKNLDADTANDVTYIAKAESFDGQLTAIIAASGGTPAKYTISGSQYVQNANTANHMDGLNTYNTGYDYYQDDNGYIIYTVQNETASHDYVMIESLQWVAGTVVGDSNNAKARLVFMDGTTKVVNLDSVDGYTPVLVDGAITTVETATGETLNNLYYTAATSAADMAANAGTTQIVNTNYLAPGYYYTFVAGSAGSTTAAGAIKLLGLSATADQNGYEDTSTATTAAPSATQSRYVSTTGAAVTATSTASNNATKQVLYTYKVLSNGKYQLTTATGVGDAVITTGNKLNAAAGPYKGNSGMFETLRVDDNTVFIVAKTSGTGNDGYAVYTGKSNAPTITFESGGNHTTITDYTYATEKGIATYVVISNWAAKTSTGSYVYLLSSSRIGQTTYKAADGSETPYDIYPAYISSSNTVEQILVNPTVTVGTIATNGINKYDPTFDNNGFYDALTLSTITGVAQPNLDTNALAEPTLGYKLGGSTLSAGKVYGSDTYSGNNAFNVTAPSTAIYVEKSGGNYTVDTVANMPAYDDNDQVFAIWNGEGTAAAVIYVIKQDTNATGASVTGTSLTTATAKAASGAVPAYTYYGVTSTNSVSIVPNALVKLEIEDITGYAADEGATIFAANYNFAANTTEGTDVWTQGQRNAATGATAAGHTYIVRITAEDGTVSYIVIGCAA